MKQLIERLFNRKDEDGASAVEYGLLVAAIAAVIVLIVFALGNVIDKTFTDTCKEINKGTACPTASS